MIALSSKQLSISNNGLAHPSMSIELSDRQLLTHVSLSKQGSSPFGQSSSAFSFGASSTPSFSFGGASAASPFGGPASSAAFSSSGFGAFGQSQAAPAFGQQVQQGCLCSSNPCYCL